MPDLDSMTDDLFESELGVNGKQVTLEYIRNSREARDYPVDDTTEFGGRTTDGLEELTRPEAESALKEVDDLISEFGL
jgi:hypothetical protein